MIQLMDEVDGKTDFSLKTISRLSDKQFSTDCLFERKREKIKNEKTHWQPIKGTNI
jgi:hypothetical protein